MRLPPASRVVRSAIFSTFALSLAACDGLIFEEFEGSFKAKFTAKSTGSDPTFEDERTVDPNENPDVKNYRDSIVSGKVQVDWVQATIYDTLDDNKAEWGEGDLFARRTGAASYPDQPLASFRSVPIVEGQSYRLDFSEPANKKRLIDLVFDNPDGKVDAYMTGRADTIPVHFEVEVEFHLSGEVALP